MVRTLQKILEGLALRSKGEVGQLDCVSDEDKQRMAAWNPKSPYAQMTCMHYLVEAVARAIPNSEAVCAWDGSLSYSQLDAISSTAAQQLIHAGVRPGIYVPFAFEKSLWTAVATLAILKAGGAFVPLDPTHPKARLREILTGIQADVIVTSDTFSLTFKGIVKNVIVLSQHTVCSNDYEEIGSTDFPVVQPSDPIFVLFTSGSTGQPKGMILEHGAICTHAIAHGKAMGYQGARVLQFAAHTFDVAIMDIFTTLIFGGTICIPSEEDRRNNITAVISSMKANYAILTPSFANLIDPDDVPTLKTLAIGGEALTRDQIHRWAHKVSLIQIYGPAEVGICLLTQMHPDETLPETVGYPLSNSSCWLVDPENPNTLVPIGAVGELVVAGPSLATRYLNNDAKTKSSFLTDLTWANALALKHQRFYRSGDLLRYNVDAFDGSYDFVGRKDTQIKLRGQRIETGDVEHHIASMPGVAISMVTRPKSGCFTGELVAIVQMRKSKSFQIRDEPISISPDQYLSIETVKEHLAKSLPAYMWPVACLVITSMPFVASMKINRRSIDTWLEEMSSRLAQVTDEALADIEYSHLNLNEVTANAISVKYAELVIPKDDSWRQKLAGSDFCLQKAGIDSIQIISFSAFLQKKYLVKVPMHRLLNPKTTIRDLAYLVDYNDPSSVTYDGAASMDVFEESRTLHEKLIRDIETQNIETDSGSQPPIRNIFLTGASGYLGSAILQDLMRKPDVFVIALVRCPIESEGVRRIIDAAIKTGWWQEAYTSRIHVWKGELTEDNFGLNNEQLRCLHGTSQDQHARIHAIIHNGAKVHYSSDYETLKAVNVKPTLNLFKIIAKASNISIFVYVSGGQRPRIEDQESPESEGSRAAEVDEENGYAQSKYVSESIVEHCARHPLFHNKYFHTVKPGYIIGSHASGIAKQSDFIWRLVAGCLGIKAYSQEEAAKWLFIADVDNVAQRIVGAVFDPRHRRAENDNHQLKHTDNHVEQVNHHVEQVLDGLLFSDLWALLAEKFGYELQPLPHEEWLKCLYSAIAAEQEEHLLFPLLHTLEKDNGKVGSTEIPMGVESAALMREVVGRNVEYLIEVGFLPAAPATRTLEDRHDALGGEVACAHVD